MLFKFSIYALIAFLAALLTLILAAYVWRLKPARVANALTGVMLSVAWWSLGYALELMSPNLADKVLWAKLEYLGIVALPSVWLYMVLRYTDRIGHSPRLLAALLVVPGLTLIAAWTNDSLGLLWRDVRLSGSGVMTWMDFDPGGWYYVNVIYSYLVDLAAVVVLAAAYVRTELHRRSIGVFLIAGVLPLVGNLAYALDLTPSGFDLTVLGFVIGGTLIVHETTKSHMLDMVPFARDNLMESMQHAIVVLDTQNRVVDYNPAAQRLLRLPGTSAVGMPAAQIFAPWGSAAAPYRDLMDVHTELVVGNPGDQRYYDLRISPVQDRFGEIGGRLIVLQDITPQKQAEERLRAAHERLLELDRMKDQFVANVSHELRTPITNLRLYHYLLRKNPGRSDEYLDVLDRDVTRLQGMVEELLYLSRLEGQAIVPVYKAVDLGQLIGEYVADRLQMARQLGLEIVFNRVPGLPSAHGDRDMLGKVISILLTNAFNYTPSRGKITVQLHTDPGTERVGFSVSDTGLGIPPDEQADIFTRFFRGTASSQAGSPGTGLGLAIAREIVDAHGGTIFVRSEGVLGRGSTFTVWLPTAEVSVPVA